VELCFFELPSFLQAPQETCQILHLVRAQLAFHLVAMERDYLFERGGSVVMKEWAAMQNATQRRGLNIRKPA